MYMPGYKGQEKYQRTKKGWLESSCHLGMPD